MRLWPLDFSSVLLEAGEIADTRLTLAWVWGELSREGWDPLVLVLGVLFSGWTVSYGVRELP